MLSPYEPASTAHRALDVIAAWYSKRYTVRTGANCEVSYFSLDSIVVFLEEDGIYKKFLTTDGLVGWTWFTEHYNDCFEEVKTES